MSSDNEFDGVPSSLETSQVACVTISVLPTLLHRSSLLAIILLQKHGYYRPIVVEIILQ